nr:nitrate reductase molybdenum cofactor assembly chaperone [Propionibacterium sp.]
MSWFGRRRARPRLSPFDLATTWQAASLLLDYPSEELRDRLPAIKDAVAQLPPEVAQPLTRLADWLASGDLSDRQTRYVDTFDHTRRCALHLTYYAFGDTRKRGVALVRFKQAFRTAGLEVTTDELPDHLCVVLEFGALGDREVAWKLLNDHRAGLEVLRLALAERRSPWLDGVLAVTATLPPLGDDETAAVAKLLAEGPPGEEVGMDAYALDPRLNPHPAADEASVQGALA